MNLCDRIKENLDISIEVEKCKLQTCPLKFVHTVRAVINKLEEIKHMVDDLQKSMDIDNGKEFYEWTNQ